MLLVQYYTIFVFTLKKGREIKRRKGKRYLKLE